MEAARQLTYAAAGRSERGDADLTQIYEGTNQVRRIVMARLLLAGVQPEI